MTLRPHSLLLLALFLSNTTNADTISPYVKFDAFLLSEPVALDAISKDWNTNYHPHGENQIASVWIESGIKKGAWSYGALFREEHQLSFSSDTADLYYTVANDLDLTTNRRYQLDLDTYRFRGYGARVSRHFKTSDKLKFTLGSSIFYASNVLSGSLSGSARANSADEYTYDFEVDYQYDKDILIDRKGTEPPNGIGLAVDVSMQWKATKQLQINADIKDLAGMIYWKDVPYTKAVANSDTVTVDNNGFSHVDPILTGIEGYKSSYMQRLKPSANLAAEYSISNSPYSFTVQGKHYENLNLFSVGGGKETGLGKVSLHYWPQIDTTEARYQSKDFGLSLAMDNLDLSDTRTFWLTVNYRN